MKRLLKTIFGRLTVVLAAIFLQVWLFVYIIFELGAEYRYVDLGIKLLAVIFVFWILNNWMNPAYKLLWSILILAVPVVGVVLYYIMGQSRVTRQVRRRYESAVEFCKPLMQQKDAVAVSLRKADEDAYRQSSYLSGDSGFPAYHNTKTVFFPTGEEMYARMKEELEKAKHFIFIEYFIVAEGEMGGRGCPPHIRRHRFDRHPSDGLLQKNARPWDQVCRVQPVCPGGVDLPE